MAIAAVAYVGWSDWCAVLVHAGEPALVREISDAGGASDTGNSKPSPLEPVRIKRPVTQAEIGKIIRKLDSDKFAEREAAVTELLYLGKPVILQLKAAAVQGSSEVSWRSIYILNEMALRLDFEEIAAAEKALRELSVSDHPGARQRAAKIIATLDQQRGARAFDAVTKLGGKIVLETYLKLDADWKGGDAGLGYVARLTQMDRISIEASSGVSEAAVAKLRKQMPGVPIHLFGKAFLGVGGDFSTTGMIVTSVVPDSGADKAGVQTNDIIILIDGKKVDNFNGLVKMIKDKEVGDEITLKYYRHVTGDIVQAKTKLTGRPGSLSGVDD